MLRKLTNIGVFRGAILTLVVACCAGVWIVPAKAQARDGMRFSCQSLHGRRTFCGAGRSRDEVRLVRQLSRARCIEGSSWGREEGRVWVDRGCQAEFVVIPFEEPMAEQVTRIEAGTIVAIRTNETIRTDRVDGRIFTGIAAENVTGSNGRLAIPRGSAVELIAREARDGDLVIDLESVTVEGRRYAIDAAPERVEARDGIGANRRTGEFVGGGAVLGAIIGAIAGGGKGAAIGAGAGAAGGAVGQIITRGRELRIPAESVVTFRIEQPLTVGVPDRGRQGDGYHYHPRDDR